MKIEIKVTEKHIKEGHRGMSTLCPVALAACEATGFPMAWVQDHFMCLLRDGDPIRWVRGNELPEEVKHFIRAFDDGLAVGPFTFAIDVPDVLTKPA